MSDVLTPTPWLARQAYNLARQRWLESSALGIRAIQEPSLTEEERKQAYHMLYDAALALLPSEYALELLARCLPQLPSQGGLLDPLRRVISLLGPEQLRVLLPQLQLRQEEYGQLCQEAFGRREFEIAEALGDCWVFAYPGKEANSASTFLPWVYWRQLRYEKALQAFQECYAYNHAHELLGGLGIVLAYMGRYEESVSAYKGVALDHPLNGQECRSYSNSLFGAGHVRESMEVLEGRLQDPIFAAKAPKELPRWNGEALNGTLLVLTDVGWSWGDHLQYLRYIPALRKTHPNIRLQADPALVPVLQQLWPEIEIDASVQARGCVAYVWLMSLPVVLNLFDTAAAELPWLRAPQARQKHWSDWLNAQDSGTATHQGKRPRIGLCWKGNPNTYHDKNRSLSFTDLDPIFNTTHNVDWVNLQFDYSQAPAPGQLEAVGSRWVDPMPNVSDFMDTVAIACCLDEVLTIDTATAHACGSAGVPMTLLVPVWGEWRWQHESTGSRSIWYPSATLVRTPGGQHLAQTLRTLADSQWLQTRLNLRAL